MNSYYQTYLTFMQVWFAYVQALLEVADELAPFSISHTTLGRPDLKLVLSDGELMTTTGHKRKSS